MYFTMLKALQCKKKGKYKAVVTDTHKRQTQIKRKGFQIKVCFKN